MTKAKELAEGVRQCILRKGTTHKTAWIPERFATRGSWILLIGDDESWCVIETGIWLPSMGNDHGYFTGGVFFTT